MPEGITDRNADVWESLLAIADAAGGPWPELARVSAVTFVTDAKAATPSLGIRLLTDFRTVFGSQDALSTVTILDALIALDESPWGDLRGKPLDSRRLSKLLKPYEIAPKLVRIGSSVCRGYHRTDLHDPWVRYLTPTEETPLGVPTNVSVTPVTDVTDRRKGYFQVTEGLARVSEPQEPIQTIIVEAADVVDH
jgi:hypothetical protein